MRPVAVVVSGAQCVGKTTLAEAVAIELRAAVLSRDPLMDALMRFGVNDMQTVAALGLELQSVVLERQLRAGLSAVLECVAPPEARRRWRGVAREHGAAYVAVHCHCSDRELHRARFDARIGDVAHQGFLTWEMIERTVSRIEPDDDAVMADAVMPVEHNVRLVVDALRCLACGRPSWTGDHAACALDPPRVCERCGRKLRVQVFPDSYRSRCPVCDRKAT